MKRVGVDAHVLTGKHQGSRTYLENVLREVGKLDPRNAYVLYSHDPAATAALLPYPNFRHHRISVPAVPRLLAYWEWARRRDRLDVLVTQYVGPPFYGGRELVVVHDLLFESHPQLFPAAMRWRLKLGCRLTARRALRVFTVSDFTARELERRYRVRASAIRITRNGFTKPPSFAAEHEAAARALRPYVLCVGRIEPRKNIGLAIAATARFRETGGRLVIVGREDGADRQTLRALAAATGIVHLRDIDDAQLASLYRHASVLFYPSSAEGFGLPVIEALGHGTPVVASSQTAIPEVGGPFARYFDPCVPDAAALAATLLTETIAAPPKHDESALRAHLALFDWRLAARTFVDEVEAL